MKPEFESLSTTAGLAVIDPIETRRFALDTPTPVEPTAVSTDRFTFTVSAACSIRAASVSMQYMTAMYVRNADGRMQRELDPPTTVSLPEPEEAHLIELNAPLKVYLLVDSAVEVSGDTEGVELTFDGETELLVGARSYHHSPAATITVPDDPRALMEAVTAFSSALKSTTPERSFPTLRGHPPKIERGDRLSIPDCLDVPETGVEVVVPPEYGAIYAAAPLTYYLGAKLVAGPNPAVRTATGFEHPLGGERGFEGEIERVLKQTLLLDCVTRTEGVYPVDLHARRQIESTVDLDFAALYDRPLGERLAAYLDVPYAAVSDAVPTWPRVVYVHPEPEHAAMLPYLVNDLSVIRSPPEPEPIPQTEQAKQLSEDLEAFKREPTAAAPADAERLVRGPESAASESRTPEPQQQAGRATPPVEEYVEVPDVDAVETAWLGEGTPTSGSKLVPAAFDGEYERPNRDYISVTVVCNEEEMREEWDAVADVYGTREDIPFEVETHFDKSTDELHDLLEAPTDLFHYIGHIDDRGFKCPDGFLDAHRVREAGPTAFLLNACRSHDQGVALLEAGSRAGVVSLSDVGHYGALNFGEIFVRLLHYGYSVGTALKIARDQTFIGRRYIGIGDTAMALAQCEDMVPVLNHIESESSTVVEMSTYAYSTNKNQIGGCCIPFLTEGNRHYLYPGYIETMTVSRSKVESNFKKNNIPLIEDNEIIWSSEWVSDD